MDPQQYFREGILEQGYQRWTVRLLADKAVELNLEPSLSHMTVQRVLKNEDKPHLSKYWKIPPEGSAAFVAAMEGCDRTPHQKRLGAADQANA